MNTTTSEVRLLQSFSNSMTAETARSLDLLRDIDETLQWARIEENRLESFIANSKLLADIVAARAGEADVIDPDGALNREFEAAQDVLIQYHELMLYKHRAACEDQDLVCDDGVEDAYESLCAKVRELVDATQHLRDVIAEHDIDAVPHEVREENLISSPDEIRSALRAMRG